MSQADVQERQAWDRLELALAEQSRLRVRYGESAGTSSELSAYWRLRDATKAVARYGRLLAAAREGDDRFAFSLFAGLSAPSAARFEVECRLQASLDPAVLRTVTLLVSETVTNAVKFGAVAPVATVRIVGDLSAERLHLEVTNAGQPFDHVPDLPPASEPAGRGLFLVNELARDWGAEHADGTTTVWFELAA